MIWLVKLRVSQSPVQSDVRSTITSVKGTCPSPRLPCHGERFLAEPWTRSGDLGGQGQGGALCAVSSVKKGQVGGRWRLLFRLRGQHESSVWLVSSALISLVARMCSRDIRIRAPLHAASVEEATQQEGGRGRSGTAWPASKGPAAASLRFMELAQRVTAQLAVPSATLKRLFERQLEDMGTPQTLCVRWVQRFLNEFKYTYKSNNRSGSAKMNDDAISNAQNSVKHKVHFLRHWQLDTPIPWTRVRNLDQTSTMLLPTRKKGWSPVGQALSRVGED